MHRRTIPSTLEREREEANTLFAHHTFHWKLASTIEGTESEHRMPLLVAVRDIGPTTSNARCLLQLHQASTRHKTARMTVEGHVPAQTSKSTTATRSIIRLRLWRLMNCHGWHLSVRRSSTTRAGDISIAYLNVDDDDDRLSNEADCGHGWM